MVKFGFLLLNEGQFKLKQVVSSNWIHEAKKPYKQFEAEEDGTARYGYGYQLWTCEITNSNTKIEYYYANGLYGQYIFIVPNLNILAVAKSYLQDDQSSAPRLFFENFYVIGRMNETFMKRVFSPRPRASKYLEITILIFHNRAHISLVRNASLFMKRPI